MSTHKPPKELDAIADVILAYHPKPKSKGGKKRKRLVKQLAAASKADKRNRNIDKSG
jgi:alpha/beta superfamily hydrolase